MNKVKVYNYYNPGFRWEYLNESEFLFHWTVVDKMWMFKLKDIEEPTRLLTIAHKKFKHLTNL